MARIESGARPSDVRHGAGHVLFVEGSTPETIDPVVLSGLLTKLSILVEPLGPARSLENVASAMHARHPNYYFLIDRDHRTTEVVEQSWREFPNERTSNLLIWRRRHLENYFLDVDYLALSQFVTCGKDQLIERIERAAAKRIYMEAANLVIIGIRETQKKSWIEKFDSCAGFESRDSGRSMLVGRPEFNIRLANVGVTLEPEAIAASYDSEVCDLLGGESVPVYGKGTWLHRMGNRGEARPRRSPRAQEP